MINGEVRRLNCSRDLRFFSRSIGTAYALLNDDMLPRSPGLAKSIIDQYSSSLFSTGVPDMAIKPSDFREHTAFLVVVEAFLMF